MGTNWHRRELLRKGQNPLHQFPSSKLARAKVRCVCCVVSFPKFHYNDLLSTCGRLVSDTANYLNMSRSFAVSVTSPQ